MEDGCHFFLEQDGRFLEKPLYDKLKGMVIVEDLWKDEERKVFSNLWKSSDPSNVVAFSWKLLVDCILTRRNPTLRNVLSLEVFNVFVCVWGGGGGDAEESLFHRFLHFGVAKKCLAKANDVDRV